MAYSTRQQNSFTYNKVQRIAYFRDSSTAYKTVLMRKSSKAN